MRHPTPEELGALELTIPFVMGVTVPQGERGVILLSEHDWAELLPRLDQHGIILRRRED